MNDEEFARKLGIFMNEMLDSRKNEDFVVNQPQLDKYLEAVSYFQHIAENDPDTTIEPIKIIPKEQCGYLTVYCNIFYINGADIRAFSEVISYCSAFTVDPLIDDRVCISLTVPDVYIEKDQTDF